MKLHPDKCLIASLILIVFLLCSSIYRSLNRESAENLTQSNPISTSPARRADTVSKRNHGAGISSLSAQTSGNHNQQSTVSLQNRKSARNGTVSVIESNASRTVLGFEIGEYTVERKRIGDRYFSEVEHPGMRTLKSKGNPALPSERTNIVIPAGASLSIITHDSAFTEIEIDPPRASLGFNLRQENSDGPAVADTQSHQFSAPFPKHIVALTEPYNIREVSSVGVLISPFQYFPETSILRVYTRLTVEVITTSTVPGDDIPAYAGGPKEFARYYESYFANFENVSDRHSRSGGETRSAPQLSSSTAIPATANSGEDGALLLIAADSLVGGIAPFIEWKKQRGLQVITAQYPTDTGSGTANLGTYIQQQYDQKQIAFVILVGDIQDIPVMTLTPNPSDTTYTLVAGDDQYHDMYISRVSARTVTEVEYQLSKFINYEKYPPAASGSSWYTAASLVASNEGANKSDFGLNDWQQLENEGVKLGNFGFDVLDKFYDPGAKVTDVLSALNAGRSLVYYLGHGSQTRWVTTGFSVSHVNSSLDNPQLPYIVNGNCQNGAFHRDGGDCLAEAIMKLGSTENPAGAIGVISSTTDMDWDPPIVMEQKITDFIIADTFETVGGIMFAAIQSAMDWCYETSGQGTAAAERIMEQTHLFGDCTLGLRMKPPKTVAVAHNAELTAGDAYPVNITHDGTPYAGALICLYRDDGIQETRVTDQNGNVNFTVNTSSLAPLTLTVYDNDIMPYQSSITVAVNGLAITPPSSMPVAIVGDSYLYTFAAVSGTPPYSWSIDGAVPTWLSINAATGEATGVPDAVGTYTYDVELTDSEPTTAKVTVTTIVTETLRITTESLPDAFLNTAYSSGISIDGGASPYTFTVDSGILPPGLMLSASGTIEGVPTSTGTYTFSLTVTDNFGSTDAKSLSVPVRVTRGDDADINGDGTIDNQEILTFVDEWDRENITESQLTTAINEWRTQNVTASRSDASRSLPSSSAQLEPVFTITIAIDNRDQLQQLIAHEIEIERPQGDSVTAFVDEDELRLIRDYGFTILSVKLQEPPIRLETETRGFGGYHTYASLTQDLSDYAVNHPAICRLISIGKSIQNRDIWALKITDSPDLEEDEPEFKYVSTMHGDESLGTEMCLYLIDLLLTEYATNMNSRISNLVDETEIWIVPLMNPDGLELGTRKNAADADLNRSFPFDSSVDIGIYNSPPLNTTGLESEVAAIMDWSAQHSFVLSANFHTGALVVVYPYGNYDKMGSSDTPDDAIFQALSQTYTTTNSPMFNVTSIDGKTAINGMINGADWFAIDGEMADWNYRYLGAMEITVELSDAFRPSSSQIVSFWNDNQESMLSYIEAVHQGVRGIVRDENSGDPLWAEVSVAGNDRVVYTDRQVGDYHRLLLPETYSLTFSARGYAPKTFNNVVVQNGAVTRVDVELVPNFDHSVNRSVKFADYDMANDQWTIEAAVDITLDTNHIPSAYIVNEHLPAGWEYVTGSSFLSGAGTDEPVLNGQTNSWLVWSTDVDNHTLTYQLRSTGTVSASVSFSGDFEVLNSVTPIAGASTWPRPQEFALSLKSGWNLISIPLTPAESTAARVFYKKYVITSTRQDPNSIIKGQVWTWENNSLTIATSLEPYHGYWVFTDSNTNLLVLGYPVTETSITLDAGWNLFGPVTQFNSPYSAPAINADILYWSDNRFVPVPPTGVTSILAPGKAYWIYSTTSISYPTTP